MQDQIYQLKDDLEELKKRVDMVEKGHNRVVDEIFPIGLDKGTINNRDLATLLIGIDWKMSLILSILKEDEKDEL